MQKISKFIKSNTIYILLTIIFFSFLAINTQVVNFGDDYWFLRFKDSNLSEVLSGMTNFYCETNGRFIVHLLVIAFLKLPMFFWQLLNSIFLTSICFFISKISKNKEKQPLIVALMFFFISILQISITRQSVYWLTGSFNYVYPIVLLLIYWYSLNKIENKKFFILSIVLGFLASATMEQSAMMTLGLTVLTFLSKFDNIKNIKKTIHDNKKLITLLLTTLVGACTVLLAPAQFVRIGIESENVSFLEGMVNNLKFLLRSYTRMNTILIYAIIFDIISLSYAYQKGTTKEKKIIYLSSLLNPILIIINILLISSQSELLKLFISALIILTYTINFIYLNIKIYKKNLINPLTIALILMIGSQAMMLVSPIIGERNLIFGLIMFAFIISFSVSNLNIKYEKYLIALLVTLALISNIHTAIGYAKTKYVDNKNFEILASTPQEILNNKNEKIILYRYENDDYSWSQLYKSKNHTDYFKKVYNIKCDFYWKTFK